MSDFADGIGKSVQAARESAKRHDLRPFGQRRLPGPDGREAGPVEQSR